MDGNEKLKGVTIIAAMNRPDYIDPVCTHDYNYYIFQYVINNISISISTTDKF